MNEFESNLESPHDRNTDDNDYRPQHGNIIKYFTLFKF